MTVGVSSRSEARPMVPRTLLRGLATHPLPHRLCLASGLPEGSTVAAFRLDQLGPELERLRSRVRSDFCGLLAASWSEVFDVRVVDRPWPSRLHPRRVEWPEPVRRCLIQSRLIDDSDWFARATYRHLFGLTRMGDKLVFDFALAAEEAVDLAYDGFEEPRELGVLARKVAASSWAGMVSKEDPRFRDLLVGYPGTLAEQVQATADGGPAAERYGSVGVRWTLPEIFDRVAAIEATPLDVALRDFVEILLGLDGSLLDAMLARLGIDGQPGRTLHQAANGTNISAERLRQLQTRISARLPSHPVLLPALDRAIELLTAAAPCSADEGARLLLAHGISTVRFTPKSVLAAADLCGRTAGFELEETRTGSRVVTSATGRFATKIASLASSRTRYFGAVSVAELTHAAVCQGLDVSATQVRDVIEQHLDAEFLDEDWFSLPGGRDNRLIVLARRILAVASPLEIATLRAGVCRAHQPTRAHCVPPTGVMGAIFSAHPDFSVLRRDRVRPAVRLDRRAELTATDRIFVDALRSSSTGVLDRAAFRAACLSRGMIANSFGPSTIRSAVLDNPTPNTWCLRGTRVNPRFVVDLTAAASKGWKRSRALARS